MHTAHTSCHHSPHTALTRFLRSSREELPNPPNLPLSLSLSSTPTLFYKSLKDTRMQGATVARALGTLPTRLGRGPEAARGDRVAPGGASQPLMTRQSLTVEPQALDSWNSVSRSGRRGIDNAIDLGGVAAASPGGLGGLPVWPPPRAARPPPACQSSVPLNNCSQSVPPPDRVYGGDSIQRHCRPFVSLTAIHCPRGRLQLLHTADDAGGNKKSVRSPARHCAAECSRTRGLRSGGGCRRRWRGRPLRDATIRTTMRFSH
ncbi:hypothetical protein EYF80_046858 [Liparis tanakae]|uniref:Uncharacterized protein n=1 Tax=Liparis tanakae TaxID=230148 RepID=A0A4Z2FP81_9TELE|nr:hypothetical protein EYF80_046858 [Liparis tanakae]